MEKKHEEEAWAVGIISATDPSAITAFKHISTGPAIWDSEEGAEEHIDTWGMGDSAMPVRVRLTEL